MANISKNEIDTIYAGLLSPDIFEHQMHSSLGIPDYLGLKNTPSTRVEAACAVSGGLASMNAIIAVGSGMYDVALSVGAEK